MKLKKRRVSSKELPISKRQLHQESQIAANSTYSYRSRRSEETFNVGRKDNKTKEKLSKANSFWLQRFGLGILIIAVIVSIVHIMSLSSSPEIDVLNRKDTASLYPATQANLYKSTVSKILSSSILNSNKLTIDTGKIEHTLMSDYPEVSSVSVSVPLMTHQPVIYIEQAEPAIILVEGNGAFVVGTNGYAILQGSTPKAFSLPTDIPVVTDQSNLKVKLGTQIVSTTNITFISTVLAELAAKGYQSSYINLPAASSELDVGISGQPYYVKFNLENNDPRMQAGTFLATITNLKSQNITPGKYVDVRIDGRAYYQ